MTKPLIEHNGPPPPRGQRGSGLFDSADPVIERMAQAIYAEYVRRAGAHGIPLSGPATWAELLESSRWEYRATACAAHAAIPEP